MLMAEKVAESDFLVGYFGTPHSAVLQKEAVPNLVVKMEVTEFELFAAVEKVLTAWYLLGDMASMEEDFEKIVLETIEKFVVDE